MNVTDKKMQANQQNAKHSAGPKTPEGKKKSSINALKHGIFSGTFPDPKIDGSEAVKMFDELKQSLFNKVRDDDPVGLLITDRLMVNMIRKHRLLKYEARMLQRSADDERSREML